MSDEIRRLSDELARDPSSLVFVPLGEALRRQGATLSGTRITPTATTWSRASRSTVGR